MPWTDYAKNRFFAPKLSELSVCGAPALDLPQGDSESWATDFVWNAALRFSIPDPQRQLFLATIRRTQGAMSEYQLARADLTAFFERKQVVGLRFYFRALLHFEICIGLTYQAWMLARRLLPKNPQLFEPGDGSDIERLNKLYNASKHAEKFIFRGQYAAESTLSIWITDASLEGTEACLPFVELKDMLDVLGRIAFRLAHPDSDLPLEAQDRES